MFNENAQRYQLHCMRLKLDMGIKYWQKEITEHSQTAAGRMFLARSVYTRLQHITKKHMYEHMVCHYSAKQHPVQTGSQVTKVTFVCSLISLPQYNSNLPQRPFVYCLKADQYSTIIQQYYIIGQDQIGQWLILRATSHTIQIYWNCNTSIEMGKTSSKTKQNLWFWKFWIASNRVCKSVS